MERDQADAVPGETERVGGEGAGDPARSLALLESGLGARPDAVMDFYARWVCDALAVPTASVSLVGANEQIMPGASGWAQPWASRRSIPLSHAFCPLVVLRSEPLVIDDARQHPFGPDHPAVAQLGVLSYAGMPLADRDGVVLGALCALDVQPRVWSPEQLEQLRRIAVGCAAELRLRLAEVDAGRERTRRDRLETDLRGSFERSQMLLSASQAFTDTATIEDVQARVTELAGSSLSPSYVGLSLVDAEGRLRRLPSPRFRGAHAHAALWQSYPLDMPIPSALAARENRVVHCSERAEFDACYPEPAGRMLRALDLHAIITAPLLGSDGALGALIIGWDEPRLITSTELLMVNAIAGYAAQAIQRARYRRHRQDVTDQLQQAMLTTLPVDIDLSMAAAYQPADTRENVGGDWYDAVPLAADDGPEPVPGYAISVGDVTGHDVAAAAVMGQVRSMLRQAGFDHPGGSPSQIIGAFERANQRSGLDAGGSLWMAHVHRRAHGLGWSMAWTNAGHPAPVLISPDGGHELLEDHDILFGHGLSGHRRRDHRRDLSPGSLLFLYTDGLIERRAEDEDTTLGNLCRYLAKHHDAQVDMLVRGVMDTFGTSTRDDVVVMAVRVPE